MADILPMDTPRAQAVVVKAIRLHNPFGGGDDETKREGSERVVHESGERSVKQTKRFFGAV